MKWNVKLLVWNAVIAALYAVLTIISTFGSDDLIGICKSDVCAGIGVGLRDCKSLQSAWCD